jgi:hypothetical protein
VEDMFRGGLQSHKATETWEQTLGNKYMGRNEERNNRFSAKKKNSVRGGGCEGDKWKDP